MHHWVLWVGQDQSLEVEEGQIVISDKIGALAAIDVGLLQCLVKVERH